MVVLVAWRSSSSSCFQSFSNCISIFHRDATKSGMLVTFTFVFSKIVKVLVFSFFPSLLVAMPFAEGVN